MADRHSRESLIKFYQEQDEKRNPEYLRKNYSNIYSAIFKHFKSWKEFMEAAGFDYISSLDRKLLTKEQMEHIVAERIALKRNINRNHMKFYYSRLLYSSKKEYGSYEALVEKCGKKYKNIKKRRKLSKEDVIFEIMSAEARNIDISAAGINYYDTSLYQKACDLFSEHSEFPFLSDYDHALLCCGINPESVRTGRIWTPYLVLFELRAHLKQGHNHKWLEENKEYGLIRAANLHFKRFRKAVEEVKRYEELNLFDSKEEFKQIEFYKGKLESFPISTCSDSANQQNNVDKAKAEDKILSLPLHSSRTADESYAHDENNVDKEKIKELRNVNMEGRVRKKKGKDHIMNFDRQTKPIKAGELKENLRKLEKYLSEAGELVTQKEIRKETGIRDTFLVNATPTENIDCIEGNELVAEMEKKCFLEGRKFWGPKYKIANNVFYCMGKYRGIYIKTFPKQ